MIVLIVVQAGLGTAVNLFALITRHHPGAQAADFFFGAAASVLWAVLHGPPLLILHAVLGLVLVVAAAALAIVSRRTRSAPLITPLIAGGLLVLGAGFNGASFLNYNFDANSMIMAAVGFAALLCYVWALTVAAGGRPIR